MTIRYPLRRGTASSVLLEYVDSKGERSMRTVMPLAILTSEVQQSPSNTYVQARCSIAKGVRSFRCDRIVSLIDPATGEAEEVAPWVAGRQLGQGKPFSWADEDDVEEILHPIDEQAPIATHRRRRWQMTLIVALAAYAIGRFRLLHIALRYFGQKHGLWL